MVVIDWSSGTEYEFWQAQPGINGWTTSWGDVQSINGTGIGSGSTGSSISRLAGVVRRYEIAQGQINHALVFSSSSACVSAYRAPATKTDGTSTQPNCIPEGTHIRLDPNLNVDALPGITPGERAVAHALQTYGAYCVDNGGAPLAFIFESPNGRDDPYPAAGFAWDYFGLTHIPWTSTTLQVLAS